MDERRLAKDAVDFAFFGMLLYWLVCTKSGRICFLLFFIFCMVHSCMAPDDTVAQNEIHTRWGQCKLNADKIGNALDRMPRLHAIQECYRLYADDADTN